MPTTDLASRLDMIYRARDLADHPLAAQWSAYNADEDQVRRGTQALVDHGTPVLQLHRLAPSESDHVAALAVMLNYALGYGLLHETIKEVARVLKPGGVLLIYDVSSDNGAMFTAALGYKPYAAWRVARVAEECGINLERLTEPTVTYTDHLAGKIDSELLARITHDVRPYLMRLIKSRREVSQE